MEYLTVQQVAAVMNVSPGHVRRLIEAGQLPAIDLGIRGRHCWRIPKDAMLSLGAIPPPPEVPGPVPPLRRSQG